MTLRAQEGVYYNTHDYAGILRRLFIDAVDLVVLIMLAFLLFVLAMFSDWILETYVPLFFVFCYAYLAGLKSTRIGTLGYILAGVRLVNLQGQQASIWRSSFRFGLLLLGPLNFLFDILWVGEDPNRQSIRDKFAKTYVVRRNASPEGRGPISYKTYYIMSYNMVFSEVFRNTAEKRS
jgi:uncharacterized RDD family membrane protein YckC